ncbi:MAG: YpdA family putative bacillithiol disulfide reductase [Cyclobacteriaceae bacterium]|nr:YpdA family putative bacillithiol disulfide reductase [Cyclobacteriaceae bacterium]
MESYDIIIVGGGPIGMACGIEAKKEGLSYVIFDKGCLVNSIYNYPKGMTFFSTSERLEIGGVPFISHQSKPNRFEALEYYRRVASTWDLNLKLYEKIDKIRKEGKAFKAETAKGTYRAKAIIVATGFYDYPYLIGVEGEDLPKVKHYYDEPHPYFGQKIVVVGAANSAVDVALETFRKGAEVTMVVRETGIRESVKYWVKPDIENRIASGEIKAYFNSNITKITERTVELNTPEGDIVLENDFVLAMTGYKPDFSFLESMGVQFNNDEYHTPKYNPETNETSAPNVYIAGVVCGGLKTNKWFIENSREHANLIVKDLVSKLSS